MKKDETQTNESRRDFLKKSAYVAPAIVTMSVAPSVHAIGSVGRPQQPSPRPPIISKGP